MTPNLADLRDWSREARGFETAVIVVADVDALLDEVEALREQVLAGRQAAEDAAALRKAIADVLALHIPFGKHWATDESTYQCCMGCGHIHPCETVRAITPDAPASEATGRPLHSSPTEQED